MTHGSLFSGIGGFDYAAELMGWENKFHCEKDKFCNTILNYYWPNAISYDDIKTTDFTIHRGTIDVLTGGFPCQPYSVAGKRKGKNDERHLWPEMLRAIREIQPRWVVGENVRGLLSWNGGMVFDEVQADLEAEGYEVLPFLLPAAGVNAPHRRDRIWFVGYEEGSDECAPRSRNEGGVVTNRTNPGDETMQKQKECANGPKPSPDAKRIGLSFGNAKPGGTETQSIFERPNSIQGWQNFPTQSPIRLRNDGVSYWMVRHLKPEIYATISKGYTNKDLQEVREAIYSSKVQRKIGGLYQIHEPRILLEIVQLCSSSDFRQNELSPFSEEASKNLLRVLRKYGSFGRTSHGRKLEKQFRTEFADTLPYLSHEIALAAKAFEKEYKRYEIWHRNESIKALGNAIVHEVVLQIFKSIEQYENL